MTAWAELHVHLEGTLEPELIFALARRNGLRSSSTSRRTQDVVSPLRKRSRA